MKPGDSIGQYRLIYRRFDQIKNKDMYMFALDDATNEWDHVPTEHELDEKFGVK